MGISTYKSKIKIALFTANDRWIKWVRLIWVSMISGILSFVLYIYLVSWNPFNLFGPLPSLHEIENPRNDVSSELIAADGVSLGRYFRHNRSMVSYEDISPELIRVLIISEDHRFHEHSGLDMPAYLRVLKGLITFHPQGGGSTLTQQTAKNLFETRGTSLQGKLGRLARPLDLFISKTKEWIISIRLEKNFTKEEIIALYLNTVPFNNNAYGIQVAAETYFQKTSSTLNLQESAMLVGMLQNTVIFNPRQHPERARRKRNEVLSKLYNHGYIADKTFLDSVQALPVVLNFAVQNHNAGLAPYFRTQLQQELIAWCEKRGIDLFEAGLRIYTTIDSRMQTKAELAMTTHMAELQKMFDDDWGPRDPWVDEKGKPIEDFVIRRLRQTEEYKELAEEFGDHEDSLDIMINQPYPRRIFTWEGGKDTLISLVNYVQHQSRFLHTGLLSMDPHSGAVKAWVGGIDHRFFKYDHVRQGSRQAGSTFKLFVYGLAMESGYSPCQLMHDIAPSISLNGKIYQPPNADGSSGDGTAYTLRQALAKSLNTVTMQLMQGLKPENVASFAERLGIETPLEPVYSLGLGTSDVTLHDMVGAYCTFVNYGVHTRPFYLTRIEDQYGKVLEDFTPVQKQVLDPVTSYKIVHLLRGGAEEEGGSARALSAIVRDENEVGGKTGTTDNGSDGWFIGVTHDLVTGVWVGGDERSIHFPRWGASSGGRTALPIWDKYMQQVYADPFCGYRKGKFPIPELDTESLNCDQIISPYGEAAFE